MEKKTNHQANIVRIGAILPHPDPETTKLELTNVGGYQVVVGKGNFKEGDLAVYVQPDSVVPQTEPFKFIWQDHVGADGKVPESKRRITVRRFRKEWSEGLLLPVSELGFQIGQHGEMQGLYFNDNPLQEGEDVSELLGITHWVPPFDKESTVADTAAAPKRRYPKTLRGWFFWALHKLGLRSAGRALALEVAFDYPVYDVDAWKNHKNWMPEGRLVQVTEKIHGSNMRATFTEGEFYVGSHEQWKKRGDNVWWKAAEQHPEIEAWCRQNPGLVVYGEAGPTQKDKKDKDQWRYGCANGETFFFAFHVYHPAKNAWEWAGSAGFPLLVPTLYYGAFDPIETPKMADGPTLVPGAKGIREGIVVRKIGDVTSRNNLKIVSNEFLAKDSK